jgi:hypothetical protein
VPPPSAGETEVALIDAARAALHGHPQRTLQLTATHARSYPSGLLVIEREALTIDANILLGKEREAHALLLAFEHEHPRSAHVPRLRALLDRLAVPHAL